MNLENFIKMPELTASAQLRSEKEGRVNHETMFEISKQPSPSFVFGAILGFVGSAMMNKEELLNVCRYAKIKENSSDCFSVAEVKRKMLAINFYGSVHFQESNQVTELLLNNDLDEYAEVVDNGHTSDINNYSDYVVSFLSNFQNDYRKNWKSHLDEFNLKKHIRDIHCNNCKYSNVSNFTPAALNELKSAFIQFDEAFEEFKDEKPKQAPNQKNLTENHLSSVNNDKHKPAQNIEYEEQAKPYENYFRTARDELHAKNVKKFGHGNNINSNDKGGSSGILKKSLGTRKGKVFGKFQPPLKSKETKENNDQTVKMGTDDEVDERLKNIDPTMIELIKNEIMDCGSKITWDDIAGLHLAKNTIQEIVVWPMLRPDIFTGLRRPPKGILLFGPPGTGKTLIGKCIASQSNSTFFSISASSLTSKWVGDGEKMVRTLFAVAKVYQPSVVFIDEIDSLLSKRSDSEHECSRRIKTEFLVQLDGAGTGDEDRILIIGATNRPQELDDAARRRLVKRLYIPLPDEKARKEIIENLISTEHHSLSNLEVTEIAKLTEGYSGADVKNLCQEASLGPIRSIDSSMIQSISTADVRPLNFKDFELALSRIKSSVSESDLDVYLAWDKQYGCGSASNY